MKLIINDEVQDVPSGLTVTALLAHRQVKMPDMVSVEVNSEILERKAFDRVTLQEGDQVEFLYFMGGGACL